MNKILADLLQVLQLERLEINLFRGESRDIGSPQVFGGQVLGQALVAATATVENRVAHSLHAYFLRAGDFHHPIVYEVDRSRDGATFSSRRVVAIQHGQQIFHMSASFQAPEEGVEHQFPMPQVQPPEVLPHATDPAIVAQLPDHIRRIQLQPRPFEFRLGRPLGDSSQPDLSSADTVNYLWFKAVGRLPDEDSLHRSLLAYVSDYYLLVTAIYPHAANPEHLSALKSASLDHAMWFHRPARVDEWLLYYMDSPSASGARGFSRGSIFTRDGRLVASTVQEGLMRMGRR